MRSKNLHAGDAGAADGVNRCVERSSMCELGGTAVTTRLYAKDKRNLREKRRSTGIVSYDYTQVLTVPSHDIFAESVYARVYRKCPA